MGKAQFCKRCRENRKVSMNSGKRTKNKDKHGILYYILALLNKIASQDKNKVYTGLCVTRHEIHKYRNTFHSISTTVFYHDYTSL